MGDIILSGGSAGSGTTTVTGTVTADQGAPNSTANRWPVQITDGTDLALVTAAGEVNVLATAQPGVDIGDVTINNAAGASAVNIQDGGNTITVDGTVTANQGTPASTANRWPVQITDGTDLALVTAAGEVNVLATAQPGVDIGDVTINNAAGAAAVNIQDGGNTITVDGSVTVSGTVTANQGTAAAVGSAWPIKITDGTDTASVTALGELLIVGGVDINAGSTVGVTTIFQDTQPTYTNLQQSNFQGMSARGALLVNPGVEPFATTHGKAIKTVSGSFTADTDIIAAVASKRIKVIAYSFLTTGTSATTLLLKSNGTGGTELWRVLLQSITSTVMGVNLAMPAPSWIFATAAGEKLTADTSTTDTIHYSVSYFDDDAT